MEWVVRRNGVDYLDGTAANTPETAAQLLKNRVGPKIVITTGFGADVDALSYLARWIEYCDVIHVFLLEPIGSSLEQALRNIGYAHLSIRCGDHAFKRALNDCFAIAEPGDTVVMLSEGGDDKAFRDLLSAEPN